MSHRASLFRLLGPVAQDILLLRPRSLRQDALTLTADLSLKVLGKEHIPASGPFLLVTNHYTSPGFGVWWTVMALAAVLPLDLHWIITSAWTGTPFTPLSRWVLRRVARIYGFTSMPPMPPERRDAAERAAAVRRVITHARGAHAPVIALTPEGRDFPGSRLGQPPPGAGRFLLYLEQILGTIIPTGVYEADQSVCIHFGPPFMLHLPPGLTPDQQDLIASQMVMDHIAALLPVQLRGDR